MKKKYIIKTTHVIFSATIIVLAFSAFIIIFNLAKSAPKPLYNIIVLVIALIISFLYHRFFEVKK